MTRQRPVNLNPKASNLEAWRIVYPRKRGSLWRLEPMRFIPHSGEAAA